MAETEKNLRRWNKKRKAEANAAPDLLLQRMLKPMKKVGEDLTLGPCN